ncbi:sensor histidine kinase [Pararhodospirillum photometricum]|uniref:histidine kinase n=1 Tax=Pararhodospirillum photometricum DSM 122 TaxID=1150469 RepID=H6SIU3_PARPM|nr:ATP-binding protein [Pararhodospirillum photometricum]CCG06720.1 Sensor protein [Pararhodospirillum photometricum DSM 122]
MRPLDPSDDLLVFSEEAPPPVVMTEAAPWEILVADDDPEVHAITRAVLGKVRFKDRGLRLLFATSEAEVRHLLPQHPDLAVVLLDVVMETEDAGLRLVRHLREDLGNRRVRIILRTGQPGQAPERDVIVAYDINDYKAKTELTAQKLFTIIIAALRAYDDLRALEESHARLSEVNTALEQRVAERTAALVRSNAELESFAYGISHDLQEPLRMVRSYLQLIERRLGSQLDGETAAYIGFALDGAARMSTMINDLLDYARLTTRPATRQGLALEAVLHRALAPLALVVAENQATVVLPATEARVEGDEGQLARLFQNLLSNALKHRHPERAPVVGVTVTSLADRGIWRVSVCDNGPGIPPAARESVFDLFHRLDGTRSTGSGVGLALCRRIVDLHGGRLWVESTVGKGASFHVDLPAVP